MTMQRHLAIAAVSLAVLGACAQSSQQIAYSSRAHTQVTAQEVTAELKVGAYTEEGRLGDLAREAVRVFGHAYMSEGHGAIVISRPAGGQDNEGAVRAAADARAVLLASGVESHRIAEGPYGAAGAGDQPLILSYMTWEAVAPNCPDISRIDMSWTGTNSAMPSLGCALAANLAAMIANPADLVRAHPMDPSDATRRSVVMTKYRNGEVTAAARSNDASGAISSAVGN